MRISSCLLRLSQLSKCRTHCCCINFLIRNCKMGEKEGGRWGRWVGGLRGPGVGFGNTVLTLWQLSIWRIDNKLMENTKAMGICSPLPPPHMSFACFVNVLPSICRRIKARSTNYNKLFQLSRDGTPCVLIGSMPYMIIRSLSHLFVLLTTSMYCEEADHKDSLLAFNF
jgi:hypothetical protein